jgi:GT2 family glycosyltransferase
LSDLRPPGVSVVIPTHDRPDQLVNAIDGILASEVQDFELIISDSSDLKDTEKLVLRRAAQDSRIRLVKNPGAGPSRGRNLGIEAARAPIVVCTDDDCIPERDWLGRMVAALAADPQAGIAFGSVIPALADPAEGFIVGYVPPRRQRLVGRWSKLLDNGIGANMAFRREAFMRIGGFDEMLGAASYFPSAEDGDIAYRVLAAGYALLHIPEARVVHYGFRDWASGGRLMHHTYLGVGAAYVKLARLGDPAAACVYLQQVWFALMNLLSSAVRLRRPFGYTRLRALLVGGRRSFELAVDPTNRCFKPVQTS